MKLDKSLTVTSWKSLNDPGTGSYLFRQDERGNQYFVIMKDTTYHWKSRNPKNSFDDNKMFPEAVSLLSNTTTGDQQVITTYNITYIVTNPYSRLVINYTGHLQYFSWWKASKQWVLEWEAPRDYCSEYHVCGSFGYATNQMIISHCVVVVWLDFSVLYKGIIRLDARENLKSVRILQIHSWILLWLVLVIHMWPFKNQITSLYA